MSQDYLLEFFCIKISILCLKGDFGKLFVDVGTKNVYE